MSETHTCAPRARILPCTKAVKWRSCFSVSHCSRCTTLCFVLCEMLMLCLLHRFVMINVFHALSLQCAHCPGLALQQYVYDLYEKPVLQSIIVKYAVERVNVCATIVRFRIGSSPEGQRKYSVSPAPATSMPQLPPMKITNKRAECNGKENAALGSLDTVKQTAEPLQ